MSLTAMNLKEKYSKLSETNQQTIFYMARKIVERGSVDFKSGETGSFIGMVSAEIDVNKPTVQRLYYAYITKHTMEELKGLSVLFGDESEVSELTNSSPVIELNEGQKKKQKILFKDKMIDVHEEDEKFFFVLDDLLDALPVSRTNKALKNSLSIKSRKLIEVNGAKVQSIEADKVKTFLQSFIRQLQEGQQKNDIRVFLEKIHQLTLKTSDVFAEPVVQVLQPIQKEVKQESKPLEVKIIREETNPESNIVESKETIQKDEPTILKSFRDLKEEVKATKVVPLVKEEVKPSVIKKTILNIDEEKEIKALTKLIASAIGYLSPNAKHKLYEMVKQKGLVETTTATLKMLSELQDTSLFFVNKIGEMFSVKEEIRYEVTNHAALRGKERANATPEQLIQMAKEAAFFAETQTKKYVQYEDYILVLSKENSKVSNIVTVLMAEWFTDGIIMQEQIDRHA